MAGERYPYRTKSDIGGLQLTLKTKRSMRPTIHKGQAQIF